MKNYTLENNSVAISVALHGAELKSFMDKQTGTEYMWKADPQFWGRTAPVLFPFVGSVNNKQFRTKGNIYDMGQHGFARDMDFVLESQTDDELWFTLESNEQTLSKYPYAFILRIGYHLKGRDLEVIWKVVNPTNEPLPFSIGGHPAFNCPIDSSKEQTDYYIRLDGADSIVSTRLQDGLASDIKDTFELQNGYLTITKDLFDNDALIIENQNIQKVALCDESKKPYLTITMDAPLFGLWSPTGKNAPFICIEPWYGRCDRVGYMGNLADREWGNLLAAHDTWKAGFTISI